MGTPRAAPLLWGFWGWKPWMGSRNAPGSSRCPPPSGLCRCQALASPGCQGSPAGWAGRGRSAGIPVPIPGDIHPGLLAWARAHPDAQLLLQVGLQVGIPVASDLQGHQPGCRVPGAEPGVGKASSESPGSPERSVRKGRSQGGNQRLHPDIMD